jgi:hypothetical protein
MERTAASYLNFLPPERVPSGLIGEGDLTGLPSVVRRYFEYSGVLGKPRIASFAFTMGGRIRQGPGAAWMPFVSRQYNLLTEPSRVFYIRGTKTPMQEYGEVAGLRVPVRGQGLHNDDGSPFVYVELTALKHLYWNVRGLPTLARVHHRAAQL